MRIGARITLAPFLWAYPGFGELCGKVYPSSSGCRRAAALPGKVENQGLNKDSYSFLKTLQETPSPSGFEQPVQRIVRERMGEYADSIETDVHGNVIVALNPKAKPRVMIAGHCDQIGLMTRYIDDNGYIFFVSIGGMDRHRGEESQRDRTGCGDRRSDHLPPGDGGAGQ
jgi:hypothetical protein